MKKTTILTNAAALISVAGIALAPMTAMAQQDWDHNRNRDQNRHYYQDRDRNDQYRDRDRDRNDQWRNRDQDRDRNRDWNRDRDRDRNNRDWHSREYDRRQQTKNEWRNIAIGSGGLGLLGLLSHDNTLTFAGAAGALYSLNRYEQDRRSQNDRNRLRAEYFSRPYFYRDGVRYDRETVHRNGRDYYRFHRHD